MSEYISKYTGSEIDEGIAKAFTALQSLPQHTHSYNDLTDKPTVSASVAYNLLDNSDFRNPVNQRGKTTYSGNAYTIDRWRQWAGSLNVGSNGVTAYESALFQYIESGMLKNTVHTLAAKKADGTIILYVRNPYEAYAVNEYGLGLGLDGNHAISLPYGHTFEWAALYEGEYTLETLPPYIYKGYATEYDECLRYYEVVKGIFLACSNNITLSPTFNYKPKRINPTYSFNTTDVINADRPGVGPIDFTISKFEGDKNELRYMLSDQQITAGTLVQLTFSVSADL